MSSFEPSPPQLDKFRGCARLFPLPNLVLFPHVLQPLHIFEARYRDLLEEALCEDRLIAMALLAPGWESDYEGRPAVHPVACLGHIVSWHRLEEGSYNVLLMGLRRVRLMRELPPRKRFREAEAQLCGDVYPPDADALRHTLQERLRKALVGALPVLPQAREQVNQLLSGDLPLGALADILSYAMEIEPQHKQALLEELDVHRRTERLLEHLARAVEQCSARQAGPQGFPPTFSSN